MDYFQLLGFCCFGLGASHFGAIVVMEPTGRTKAGALMTIKMHILVLVKLVLIILMPHSTYYFARKVEILAK